MNGLARPVVLIALIASVPIALTACARDRETSTPDERETPARAVGAVDSISLDSCARLDSRSSLQHRADSAETLPAPHDGSWTSTKLVVLDSLRIEVPVVAEVWHDARRSDHHISGFPGCRYFCGLSVHVEMDSAAHGLDAYVARLRVVDTTSNPDAADWIPGEPQPIRVGGRRAALMEKPCGDCTAQLIVLAIDDRIVTIDMNLDDREGDQPGQMCRLTRVATTLR